MILERKAYGLLNELGGPAMGLRTRAYILKQARELAEEDGREDLTEQDVRAAYAAYESGSS